MTNWPNTIQCLGSDDIMSLGIEFFATESGHEKVHDKVRDKVHEKAGRDWLIRRGLFSGPRHPMIIRSSRVS